MKGGNLMNTNIQYYVDELQSVLMTDLFEEKNNKLYSLANDLIERYPKDEFKNICQAYEVVKHQLIG